MTQEQKIKLFEKMLQLETLARMEFLPNKRDYYCEAEGAFKMLEILGIGREYIKWSYGKTADY